MGVCCVCVPCVCCAVLCCAHMCTHDGRERAYRLVYLDWLCPETGNEQSRSHLRKEDVERHPISMSKQDIFVLPYIVYPQTVLIFFFFFSRFYHITLHYLICGPHPHSYYSTLLLSFQTTTTTPHYNPLPHTITTTPHYHPTPHYYHYSILSLISLAQHNFTRSSIQRHKYPLAHLLHHHSPQNLPPCPPRIPTERNDDLSLSIKVEKEWINNYAAYSHDSRGSMCVHLREQQKM